MGTEHLQGAKTQPVAYIDNSGHPRHPSYWQSAKERELYGPLRPLYEQPDAAAWFALVMGAAASIEDAANCLRDPDAKRQAEGAARHYREAAQRLYPAWKAAWEDGNNG